MERVLIPRTAIVGTTPIKSPFVKLSRGQGFGGEAQGNVSVQLVTDGTVDGSFKVLGSNKPDADVNGDTEAVDISAAFKTAANAALVAANHTNAATQAQGAQAGPLWFSSVAVQFTPTAGAGNASAFLGQAV